MKSNINGRGNLRKIDPRWFTGKAWMKIVDQGKEQDIYHVHFEGSRTKLHRHDGTQILIATRGRGSLETFTRTSKRGLGIRRTGRTRLEKGDLVRIPAGVLHTHGSTSRAEFAHIAINVLAKKTYKTDWFESDFKSAIHGTI